MKRILMALVLMGSVNAKALEVTEVSFIVVGATTYGAGYIVLQAAAMTTVGPLLTTIAISEDQYKLLKGAQEDAAILVASEGEVRTAQVVKAMELVRSLAPQFEVSDLEIAQAIVAM
ncbi:hypothetical protein D3C87_1361720 [compost metagenome]